MGRCWGLLQGVYTTCLRWTQCYFVYFSCGRPVNIPNQFGKSIWNGWCCCLWLPGTSWQGPSLTYHPSCQSLLGLSPLELGKWQQLRRTFQHILYVQETLHMWIFSWTRSCALFLSVGKFSRTLQHACVRIPTCHFMRAVVTVWFEPSLEIRFQVMHL